jgi:hypothetical protein
LSAHVMKCNWLISLTSPCIGRWEWLSFP